MRRAARVFLLLALLAAAAALGARSAWQRALSPYPTAPRTVEVTIPRGASARTAGEILERHGVVRHRLLVPVLARLRHTVIRAGDYRFDLPMTPDDVLRELGRGVAAPFRRVTVPEGLRIEQVADLVSLYGLGTCDEFRRLADDPSPIHDLDPDAPDMEGYLFPDTYHLDVHATAADLVAAMCKRLRAVMARESGGAPLPMPVRQWVTLASLVEEETALPAERPRVAAVYANRLARGMLLQCDPTVLYARARAHAPARELQISDLAMEHPYNTYVVPGLPPGPISSPGAESLRAALHPAATDELYFVARGDGGHEFSRTLEEHNRAVARYRRVEAAQRRAERQAAAIRAALQGTR